jgi:UPF0271 protein
MKADGHLAERVIDLNADVGEGGAFDAALFASGITSANIACGAHAGDEATMAAACALAARHGVALGAHPGYADRTGFGRRELALTHDEAETLLGAQFLLLGRAAERAGVAVRHVKPHGALYHQANRETWLARLLVDAVGRHYPGAVLFGPPAGCLREAMEAAGARGLFVPEGFVDRAYLPDGTLVPRGEPGAVLHEEAEAAAQAVALARAGGVRTLCVHGDGPWAGRLLVAARAALVSAGFRIAAPGA